MNVTHEALAACEDSRQHAAQAALEERPSFAKPRYGKNRPPRVPRGPRVRPEEPPEADTAHSSVPDSWEASNAPGQAESKAEGLSSDLRALDLAVEAPSAAPAADGSPQTAGPTIYLGAAAMQGSRAHMEDRYVLEPFFKPALPDNSTVSSLPQDLQDAAASRVNACYCGIFDGHSAADAADTAAQRMHKVLAAELGQPKQAEEGDPISAGISRAFRVVDFEIICRANRERKSFGSTALMALQLGSTMYVAHAGDSEAVLERDGEAVLVAAAHKPDNPEELARIQAKGGVVYLAEQRIKNPNGRGALNMSRSLGDPQYKRPRRLVSCEAAIRRISLRRGDTMLILASDGLWDVMTPADATAMVSHFLSAGNSKLKAAAVGHAAACLARTAAEALVQHALQRGSLDNVTAVVGLLRWEG